MSNREIFEESKKYMPGGVNSPVRAYRDMGINPPVMKSGKGVILTDEDGKETAVSITNNITTKMRNRRKIS